MDAALYIMFLFLVVYGALGGAVVLTVAIFNFLFGR